MMRRTSSRLVGMMSLREDSGSSSAVMPAALSSGMVSSKMRPLDRAMVMVMLICLMSQRGAFYRQTGDWACLPNGTGYLLPAVADAAAVFGWGVVLEAGVFAAEDEADGTDGTVT